MTEFAFAPAKISALPIAGNARQYAINRIFCVGRNYAAHALEMGAEVDREAPFYFTKSPAAYVETGADIPFSLQTDDLHHEMEFVVAIGVPVFRASLEEAEQAVFAYGCGLDMTRRDIQAVAKEKRRPWDLGKDFENSAVLSSLTLANEFGAIQDQRIHLKVNGETRQDGKLSEMIWSVPEIISDLSRFYHLAPGDIIMTGTPAGVGPVQPGDKIIGEVDGLQSVSLKLGAKED